MSIARSTAPISSLPSVMTRWRSRPFFMGPKGPTVLHVGYLPATVEEVFFPQAELIGDVGPSLALLADRLEHKLPKATALLPLREDILAHIADRAEESRFPPDAATDRSRCAPRDAGGRIVCLDNGMYKIWFARNYRTHVANTLLLDNALATMGAGLPSAIMAACLNRDRRVLAVCGDGGFMMNSQELETAVRLKLNLVVLVLQDNAYGMIRWKQAVDGFPDYGMTFGDPDFVAYAKAYSAEGSRVESADGLAPVLEAAFAAGACIWCRRPSTIRRMSASWSTNCAFRARQRIQAPRSSRYGA